MSAGKAKNMSVEIRTVEEYLVTIADDWTITLPTELREKWGLRTGDQIEFYRDHLGGWKLQPLKDGPLDFTKSLPPRARLPGIVSDEDALGRAVTERNLPPSAIQAAG